MRVNLIGIVDILLFIGFIIPVIVWGNCKLEYEFYSSHSSMVTSTGSSGNSSKVDGFPYIRTEEWDSLKSRYNVSLGFWITFLVLLVISIYTTIMSYSPATVAAFSEPVSFRRTAF